MLLLLKFRVLTSSHAIMPFWLCVLCVSVACAFASNMVWILEVGVWEMNYTIVVTMRVELQYHSLRCVIVCSHVSIDCQLKDKLD